VKTILVLCILPVTGSTDIYSPSSLASVIRSLKGVYNNKCRPVVKDLQAFDSFLRDDTEYLEDPITRFKYIRTLSKDIKKNCGSTTYDRLLKKNLLPNEDEHRKVAGVLIEMMEGYNLTLEHLLHQGHTFDHVESIIISEAVNHLDVPDDIKFKYGKMFLDNVYEDQDLSEEEENEFDRAYDNNMGFFDEVEFKRLCVEHESTIGTKRCVLQYGLYEYIHLEVLSEDPWVALHHNFLTESELENANAEIENFEFDEGTTMEEGGDTETVEFRDQINFDEGDSPFFDNINARIDRACNVVGKDLSMEIYKYRLGGAHMPHMDFYTDEHILKAGEDEGNRVAITMIFLRQTKRGGGFAMPRLGIYIAPTPGAMLIWRNVDNRGWNSQESVHGGCPVYQGVKMIAITEYNALLQNDVCPAKMTTKP